MNRWVPDSAYLTDVWVDDSGAIQRVWVRYYPCVSHTEDGDPLYAHTQLETEVEPWELERIKGMIEERHKM